MCVLDEPITDAALCRRALRGACAAVQAALDEAGLACGPNRAGFMVDVSASCDLARFFWTPSALVNGEARAFAPGKTRWRRSWGHQEA